MNQATMSASIDYHHPDTWRDIATHVFTAVRLRTTGLSGYYVCPPEWRWQMTLPDYDLWFVVAGTGTVAIHNVGDRYRVAAGTLLLLRPGDVVTAEQDPANLLTVAAAHFDCFDPATNTPVSVPAHCIPNRRIDFDDPGTIERLMKRLVRLHESARPLSSVEEHLTLTETLIETYRQDAARNGSHDHGLDPRIERVVGCLRQQPDHRLSLADAAALAGLSADYFSRLFAGQIGVPFREYTLRLRLERARQMLEETDLRIGEIAHLLGYTDPHLFSRQFHRYFGHPPRRVRQTSPG
jgi:AraC-like DNA-binding protein